MKRTVMVLSALIMILGSGCGQTAVTKEVNADAEKKQEVSEKAEVKKMSEIEAPAPKVELEPKEEAKEKKEEKELPEYSVTAFETAKTMFASSSVNVRKGPATDFDKVGGLSRAQEVSVIGQASTGWYEITYKTNKAFVSDHYLQNEKPEEQPVQQTQSANEVKNVSGVILVGDSRFVQMQENAGENSCTWIAESGKGYNWFNENAIAIVDGCVGKGSKILINLGVNDPGNINNYLTLVNAKAAEWVGKGAKVYYASVNPVWENPYVTEEQVVNFNSQIQAGLSGDVSWIDSHSYLQSIGYKLVDGLHFNSETYQNLYAYFMSCL